MLKDSFQQSNNEQKISEENFLPKISNGVNFTHLHVHSHFSLLDGLAKIDELLDRVKELGMDSVALTDHGVMYGAIEFYKKAKARGIKPIIGIELYIAPNGMLNKRPKIDDKRYHIILLAKNNIGYKNLIKLTTLAHLEGFYYKPRIDKELLKKYSEGLIGASACVSGEISRLAIAGKYDEAEKAALEYENIFGKGNFYLEIGYHPNIPEQKIANEALIKIGKKNNIGIIATNDMHYLKKEDAEAQDILLAIQTKSLISDTDRLTMKDEDFSMKSPEEMAKNFEDIPEALENTQKIADSCDLEIELGKTQLPHFEVPNGKTTDEYLKQLCAEGMEKKYGIITDIIAQRLEYELLVIKQTGFASYILIVWDFVSWAKNNNIIVGPGRGSAAGSIVSYLLNITAIDPLKYNLLFERFLNPERISMPDIDLDFADTGRDKVIEYVSKKYGKDHVAQIITFGTMAAKAAVRDTGRVLGYPYAFCDQTAKMIPMFMSLEEALNNVPELKQAYNSNPDTKKLIDSARKLEGVARHASTHACGVVITKEKLENYAPLQRAPQNENSVITQYEMHAIEDLGLLKMDFLGLKNLTIIETAIQIIKNTKNETIDFNTIPLDDQKTFELFQKGNTTGIFQYESGGMKRNLRALKPTVFEDLIAMNALYRPGPMEHIPEYIDAKHGRKKINYLHPKMKPILENTYGVIVYQEQVLEIVKQLAGFSYGEADVLRKAVGKKIKSLLEEQKNKLIEKLTKNGIGNELTEKIWNFIEPFARYGFNKSHSACYATIGYQTAYLKTNYPTEFMAALMNSEQNDIERIAEIIKECNDMDIEVLPPNINESFSNFTVVNQKQIRFGLAAVKNVGENVVAAIIAERKENGKYNKIEEFITRVQSKDLNKKSLESLVKCGATEELGERKKLLANIEDLLKLARDFQKSKEQGQFSLFENAPCLSAGRQNKNTLPPIRLKESLAATKNERLQWEKELLGLYISEHPLKEFKNQLEALDSIKEIRSKTDGNIICGGIINKIKKILTRQNQTMLFVEMEDLTGQIEIIVFPRTLESNPLIWQNDKMIVVEGAMNNKDGVPKIIANKTYFLEEYLKNAAKKPAIKHLQINLQKNSGNRLMQDLQKIFSEFPAGSTQISISIPNDGPKPNTIETPYKIKYDESIITKLKQMGINEIQII
ncbi:MAG: DNA polymerase III subunit alpha [Patescibacteria group bacterium]